ncbi:hypothetical protein EVB81_226 [Rhizobium phage RHph_I46]|uniref:Uncharacterized protein n=1 Tax=Rhizobium phage RHph_I1_9 TaxID=2509729 RepID=A0A7S5R9M4_9CAUD|nr:hypothetical protein PP936_gp224 [Rhizobium phage RHph_I1_9]QIG69795.1 hypothetical protein EVB81_226 [Rhizobium phage RHph_I46]QIG71076.1 hypothetical protein EVB92_226 [Rhizobium phage RHph_I9]QIG73661.1 hypothetical protein EVC04_224 [Rhizobium phage RHph_I1_9]QIG76415.1 hypothetical protein EVC25_226 [Rhizobium phage RHph_I34]
MKIKGAELIQFLDTGWPKPEDDYYWDNGLFEDRPNGEPDPEVTYDTDELGPILYQGPDPDPIPEGLDLAKLIRKWRKTQTTESFVVEVPKGKRDELVEFLDTINGKILK